jgi:tetratricopeptide (TPR) repeat protein
LSTVTQDGSSEQGSAEGDLLARADAASVRREHDEALRLWSEARSRFPDAPRSWLRTAEVMIELSRFDEAEAVLDEAVSRFPDHFWLARTRALIARSLGDDVEAYTRCRAVRQAFPDNPAAHADFAHLLLDLKQVAAAEAEAAAGLALFPDLTWLQHMYARCADQAGDTAAAAVRWTDLLIRHPLHEPAYAAAVRALMAVDRLDEAAGIAREGLRLFPNGGATRAAWAEVGKVRAAGGACPFASEPAANLLTGALSAERAGQWEEAASLWALLREQAPSLGLAYTGGARALLGLGRMAEAEIVLAKARRDLPPDAGVLEAWADAAVQRGAFEDALARFRSFRQAFPTAPHAALGVARALHGLGRLDEADAIYAELGGSQPSDPFIAQQYAKIAAEQGDWPEAARRWKRVTGAFPDDLPGYWHRAEALGKAERWAEADAVLSDAVARFPEDLETALRWAMSGRRGPDPESGSTRSDVLCRRFPSVVPVVRQPPSSDDLSLPSALAADR